MVNFSLHVVLLCVSGCFSWQLSSRDEEAPQLQRLQSVCKPVAHLAVVTAASKRNTLMCFLKLTEQTHKMIVDAPFLLRVKYARRITWRRGEVNWRIGESVFYYEIQHDILNSAASVTNFLPIPSPSNMYAAIRITWLCWWKCFRSTRGRKSIEYFSCAREILILVLRCC